MKWFLRKHNDQNLNNFINGIEKQNLDILLIEFCSLLFEKNSISNNEELKSDFQIIKNNINNNKLLNTIANKNENKIDNYENTNGLFYSHKAMYYLASAIAEKDIVNVYYTYTIFNTSEALAYSQVLDHNDANKFDSTIQKYINLFTSSEFINTLVDKHKEKKQDWRPDDSVPEDYYAL